MMLRIASWIVGAVAAVGAIQGAAAAELGRPPVKAPPLVVASPSWAGFYIGGQVGLGGDSVRWQNLGPSAAFSPPGAVTRDRNGGVIGGGQIGYNFQAGNIVLGIEGSLSAASFDGSFTSPYAPATATWSDRATWLGTVTGRVGYAMGDWLPYVKGGLATAKLDTRIQDVGIGGFSSGSSQHTGWTAGGGVEYRLSPKWSLGLEYLYSDLGRSNDISGPQTSLASGAPIPGTNENYSTGLRSQSLMGRLNYKIGW
jgi:outer membrane immunogenic protein